MWECLTADEKRGLFRNISHFGEQCAGFPPPFLQYVLFKPDGLGHVNHGPMKCKYYNKRYK